MMRKKIIAGNWKMNLELQEGISLFSEVVNMAGDEVRGDQELIVCAPFIHLTAISQLAKQQLKVKVGVQNIHQEKSGAFTGEVSASQVASAGAEYVIIGHSERRAYFQEDGFTLSKKINIALQTGLKPIFCVGEILDERVKGFHFDVVAKQLEEGLSHVSVSDFNHIILAYEPVWAIGTGKTATPAQAQEMHKYIRERIAQLFSQKPADEVSILYGGSCNPENAPELFAQPDIDGGLIGGASLKSRDFIEIAKVFN